MSTTATLVNGVRVALSLTGWLATPPVTVGAALGKTTWMVSVWLAVPYGLRSANVTVTSCAAAVLVKVKVRKKVVTSLAEIII